MAELSLREKKICVLALPEILLCNNENASQSGMVFSMY